MKKMQSFVFGVFLIAVLVISGCQDNTSCCKDNCCKDKCCNAVKNCGCKSGDCTCKDTGCKCQDTCTCGDNCPGKQ